MSEIDITTQIEELKSKALEALDSALDLEALDDWRISYLGRRGELTRVLRGLGSLPADERPAAGSAANALRQTLQEAMSEREDVLKRAASESAAVQDAIDVTLPGWPVPRGGDSSNHPNREGDLRRFRVDGFQRRGRVRKSNGTTTTSRCSISPRIIRRGICGIPSG